MDYQSTGSSLSSFVFSLIIYLYTAYTLYVMAQKTNSNPTWLAWVPILNVFTLLKIAGKPMWWFLLFLIPLVNFVIALFVFVGLAERLGFNKWLGLLLIIPIVNLVLLGYFAFSKPSAPMSPPAARM